MAVDGDGEHVGAVIEDLLLAVAVVVVDVEDGDAAIAGEQVRRDRRVVEIAEAAEGARLGVVARRPHQGIGEPRPFQHLLRRGQRAVDRRARRQIGVLIERREGVDAVIAGQHRLVLRRPRRIPRGKDVGVDRLLGPRHEAGLADVIDQPAVMHGADLPVREPLGRNLREQARGLELGEDRADAYRRLHIAPLLHVVDGVVVVEHERDARFRCGAHLALQRPPRLDVARLAQADGIVFDGLHDHLHIVGGRSVFSLEDGADHLPHLVAARQIV